MRKKTFIKTKKFICYILSAVFLIKSVGVVASEGAVIFNEQFTTNFSAFTPPALPETAGHESYPAWTFSLPSANLNPPQLGSVAVSNGSLRLKKTTAKMNGNYDEAIRAERSFLPNSKKYADLKGKYTLTFTVQYSSDTTEGLGFAVLGKNGESVLIDGLVNNSRKIVELTDGPSRQTNESKPVPMPSCGSFTIDTVIRLDIDTDNKTFRFYTNRIDNGNTPVPGINRQLDRQFKTQDEEDISLSAIRFFPRNGVPLNAEWRIKNVKLEKTQVWGSAIVSGFYRGTVAPENKIETIIPGQPMQNIVANMQITNPYSTTMPITAILALFQNERFVNKLGVSETINVDKGETANFQVKIDDIMFSDYDSELTLFLWEGTNTLKPFALPQERILSLEINDIPTLRSRLLAGKFSTTLNPQPIMNNINSAGKFTNVNYSLDDRAQGFGPLNALENTVNLVKAYMSEGNQWYQNPTLKQTIDLVLQDWANSDYRSSVNWWYNDIGVPTKMAELLLYNMPREAYTDKLVDIAKRGLPTLRPDLPHGSSSTGANLVDQLVVALNIAVSANDRDAVKTYVTNLLDGELKSFPSPQEGIMPDFSFQQHSALLYSGSYGTVFGNGVNTILKALKDTSVDISKKALNFYADFILDGHQWMYRFNRNDFTVAGRAISRPGGIGSGIRNNVAGAVDILLSYGDLERHEELENLKSTRLIGDDNSFSGARHFWVSDYTAFHRPNFFVGIRSSSKRTRNTEYMNGENIKGYFLADGVTTIMRTGNEYTDIFPVWDWNKLPGTTTRTVSPIPTPASEWGRTTFVGGVSDGTYALTALDYDHNNTVAKKAWFMFDKGFVALGNNINASAPGDVYTSVNQFLLNGSVLVKSGGNTQVIAKESNTLIDGCQWVLHDGIGYVFPSGQDVYIENREKVGRWSDINSGRSSATLSKDVFGLYINHRNMPVNQSYEYFVLPDMEQKELAAYATNPNITIISNTDRQQALWNKTQNVLGSVFWSSGDVEIPTTITGLEESLSISADKPCMVLLRKTGDSQWSLSVSNPENKAMSLNIKINRLLTGDGTYQDNGSTIIPFTIPEGDYAGQSITKMLKSDTTKEVV